MGLRESEMDFGRSGAAEGLMGSVVAVVGQRELGPSLQIEQG